MNRKVRAIFLDFDGVLHKLSEAKMTPENVPLGNIFEYLSILSHELLPHRDIKIVVSSSWSTVFSLEELKGFLTPLSHMVIGTTKKFELERILQKLNGANYFAGNAHTCASLRNRFEVCNMYARQNSIDDWIMIDDMKQIVFGAESPTYDQQARVIFCDSELGLTTPGVIELLRRWLDDQITELPSRGI